MIDFNSAKEIPNKFLGSEFKKTIIFNNQVYMIKFPDPVREMRNNISYKNNQFSEYIGSNIFNICGIEAQETMLGTYAVNGKDKVVVACKDFTETYGNLTEFSKLANADVTSDKKAETSIESVYEIIHNNTFIDDKSKIINGFWDMFVIDTLIGNPDRHFNNWGFIEKNGKFELSPVYDCGSSLGALHSDETLNTILKDKVEFKNREFNIKSVYHMNGKRIFYHEVYKKPIQELSMSIKRMVPKIEMDKINYLINNTPYVTELQKNYFTKSIQIRYEEILVAALKREIEKDKFPIQCKLKNAKNKATQHIDIEITSEFEKD